MHFISDISHQQKKAEIVFNIQEVNETQTFKKNANH